MIVKALETAIKSGAGEWVLGELIFYLRGAFDPKEPVAKEPEHYNPCKST